jgi:hypothetical protein
VLQLDFTGSDQLTLTNGHMYAFELTGGPTTQLLSWLREPLTRCRRRRLSELVLINGTSARDLPGRFILSSNSETNIRRPAWRRLSHLYDRLMESIRTARIRRVWFGPAASCGTTVNGG